MKKNSKRYRDLLKKSKDSLDTLKLFTNQLKFNEFILFKESKLKFLKSSPKHSTSLYFGYLEP